MDGRDRARLSAESDFQAHITVATGGLEDLHRTRIPLRSSQALPSSINYCFRVFRETERFIHASSLVHVQIRDICQLALIEEGISRR